METNRYPWFILSAKYGLVSPNEVIAPYEETLNYFSREDRRAWSMRVFRVLEKKCPPPRTLIFLAGKKYREDIVALSLKVGYRCETPMEGLGIGIQLRWLSRQQLALRTDDGI